MRPGTVVRHRAIGSDLRALAAARGTGRVLDVGGYDGSTATSFCELASRLVVLDVDGDGLRTASARGLVSLLGSARAIPLAAASVDLALCCDVLPCLSAADARGVYPEIRRVMTSGGRLLVTEVDTDFTLPFVDRATAFAQWHVQTGGFSYDQLQRLLGAAGLSVVEHRMFYGWPTRLAYTVLFFWGWPRRGARAKQRLWRSIAGIERHWCPRPQAHLIVAAVAGEGG